MNTTNEASELAASLLEVARSAGQDVTSIAALQPLAQNAGHEHWGFILSYANGFTRRLVLRRSRVDAQLPGLRAAGEATLMQLAHKAHIPVPEVLFTLPESAGLGDGFVMQRIVGDTADGEVLVLPQLAKTHAALARHCGEVLAKLHAIPAPESLGLQTRAPATLLAALVEKAAGRGGVIEKALGWLQQHLPRDGDLRLVHGDFCGDNLLIGPDGLRAVLDWEMAHIGAPASDLGQLCAAGWRSQKPGLPVGGFGTREDLLAGYAEAGGGAISAAELRAWELLHLLRLALDDDEGKRPDDADARLQRLMA